MLTAPLTAAAQLLEQGPVFHGTLLLDLGGLTLSGNWGLEEDSPFTDEDTEDGGRAVAVR